MRGVLANLFGRSPFAPLQAHMGCVARCVEKLTEIFDAMDLGRIEEVEALARDLSKLEHEADISKNDIRNTLPKSLFLSMDRSHFLDILSIQDLIADKAEEVGLFLALRPACGSESLQKERRSFFDRSVAVFWSTQKIILEFDALLESSFGGVEAEKVRSMVEKTAQLEHESKGAQWAFIKKLLSFSKELAHSDFYLSWHLAQEIGLLAVTSERLANRVRMILELK